jgi:hypothetical protein
MVSVPGNDELKPIAAEAGERITKALESLRGVAAG